MKQPSRATRLILVFTLPLFSITSPALLSGQTQEVQEGPGEFDKEGWKHALATWRSMRTMVDMRKFKGTMPLKEALGLCYEQMAEKGVDLVILADVNAFRAELPREKLDFSVYNVKVSYCGVPRYLPASVFLRLTLQQVPTGNATWIIRRDFVEITTVKRADGKWLTPSAFGGILGGPQP